MVATEWNNNAPTTRDEVRRHLVKIQDQARQLRANGFARKCVFCTSNTNDYGPPHPSLATDFAAVNLIFTTNLPWAVHEIRT